MSSVVLLALCLVGSAAAVLDGRSELIAHASATILTWPLAITNHVKYQISEPSDAEIATNAVLGNPMVTTAALPLVLGIALGFFGRASTLSGWPVPVLIWVTATIFFYWDIMGAPAMWPSAASQKLIYLALIGAAFALLAEQSPNQRVQAGGAALLIVAALLWLSWRKLLSGVDLQLATAALATLLIAAGFVALLSAKGEAPSAQTEEPLLFPAAPGPCLAHAVAVRQLRS